MRVSIPQCGRACSSPIPQRPRSRRRSARAVAPESPALPRKEEPALARFQQTPSAPDESEKVVVGLGGVLLGQAKQPPASQPTHCPSRTRPATARGRPGAGVSRLRESEAPATATRPEPVTAPTWLVWFAFASRGVESVAAGSLRRCASSTTSASSGFDSCGRRCRGSSESGASFGTEGRSVGRPSFLSGEWMVGSDAGVGRARAGCGSCGAGTSLLACDVADGELCSWTGTARWVAWPGG